MNEDSKKRKIIQYTCTYIKKKETEFILKISIKM